MLLDGMSVARQDLIRQFINVLRSDGGEEDHWEVRLFDEPKPLSLSLPTSSRVFPANVSKNEKLFYNKQVVLSDEGIGLSLGST